MFWTLGDIAKEARVTYPTVARAVGQGALQVVARTRGGIALVNGADARAWIHARQQRQGGNGNEQTTAA